MEHSVEKENVTVDNDGATTLDDSDPDSAGSDDSVSSNYDNDNVQNSPLFCSLLLLVDKGEIVVLNHV